jgi:hypothetical protein
MPSLQLSDHISSLQIRSNLAIENFSFSPPLIFRLMMKKFSKLSFGTPFKKLFPA